MSWRSLVWLVLLTMPQAQAGAWVMPKGHWQIIAGVITSHAGRGFDNQGHASVATGFDKLLAQSWVEYGLTNAVTLVVAPEYVQADLGAAKVQSSSFEFGGRLLLTRRIGMLSLQATAKSAGGFGMSTSYGGEAGRQIEMRLQYGTNFRLFRRDGYVDIEVAQRWIKRPRPDEAALDASVGLWLRPKDLITLQAFTMMSGAGVKRPFAPYAQTKLQLAFLHQLSPRWAVQSGYFYTPSGRNIVQERGAIASLWFKT